MSSAKRPVLWAVAIVVVVAVLVALEGGRAVTQTTLNGLATGTTIALGALGVALVFGVLRIISFAHGDLLTVAAYLTLLVATTTGLDLVLSAVVAIAITGLVAVITEYALWRPLRTKNAGMLQKLLVGIGLAFALRGLVQVIAGAEPRRIDVNVSRSVELVGGVRIGYVQLWALVIGAIALVTMACVLKYTSAGRQLRALSDNKELAEASGVDSGRWTVVTWAVAGCAAGLAGVLTAGTVGVITPNFGFMLLLSMFAATILGGIHSAFGALAGGLLIGLVQEWSTLFIDPPWKLAMGFAVLIITLIVRPNGLLGRAALR
ncbi:branched-chain amino acid ABC transporter permease [Nocardioides sp. LHG3406-4]|uniref:branched-chain amino acid ABC transporter permease n=1 Tax=Nocardioides sp. LHG3406-4 TaxID=2804575 RepID=UPI003CE6DB52